MEENEFKQQWEERQQMMRVKWLHVVLVLSIIGSGMQLLSNFVMGAFGPWVMAAYQGMASSMPDEVSIMYETLFNTPRAMFVCLAVLYSISLAGVILMWRLRKSGFHLYTLAQLLILVVPVLFMGRTYIAMGDIMLTVLFVAYYFFALKRLGAFETVAEEGSNFDEIEAEEEQKIDEEEDED